MDIKHELNSLRHLEFAIRSKNRQLEELKELKTTIGSPVITGMPKCQSFESRDKLEELLDKICRLEREKADEIGVLIDDKLYWTEKFRALATEESTVMEMRYFEGSRWSDIAEELNYDERSIYNIHGRALQKLNNLINS